MIEQFAILSLQSVIIVVATAVVAFYLTVVVANVLYSVFSAGLKGLQLVKLKTTEQVADYRESVQEKRQPRISTKRTATYTRL